MDCTPGAKLAHPQDCSKYYICDVDNHRSTFECPSDLLYNPVTTTCDAADTVTCFGLEEENEKPTTVNVDEEEYRGNLKDVRVEKTKQDEEPEQHKSFYFLEDSSDESSESGESDTDDNSNQDGIVINGRAFSSNPDHSKKGIHVNVKSKPCKDKENVSEKDKNNKDHLMDPSENPLDQDSHKVKEVDESGPNISIGLLYDPTEPETSEKDYETKKVEDQEPHTAVDTADGYKNLKKRLKKREDSIKDAVPETNATQKEVKTEDDLDKVEDEKSGSVSQGEELNLTGPSTSFKNDATYQITNVGDTNVLRLGSLPEPIANWTEVLYNGWTDLLIFWKHPVDEDFRGSVFFKYPSDSMSNKLEIKDLVLEILQLADIPEESDSDEAMDEVHPEVDIPQETSVKETQTT